MSTLLFLGVDMPPPILTETFDAQVDTRLRWFCKPENWSLENGNLILRPTAKTDFWQV
jgi:hypothetical protein